MDDRTGTSTAGRVVLAALGFLVAALAARAVLGDLGVQVVLLVTLAAVSALAWTSLTGRPLPRPAQLRSAPPAAPPVAEDLWRSDRWIRECVERGLRALDEWRLEQRGV